MLTTKTEQLEVIASEFAGIEKLARILANDSYHLRLKILDLLRELYKEDKEEVNK